MSLGLVRRTPRNVGEPGTRVATRGFTQQLRVNFSAPTQLRYVISVVRNILGERSSATQRRLGRAIFSVAQNKLGFEIPAERREPAIEIVGSKTTQAMIGH